MRLLHVVSSTDPRSGGPIEAVRRSGTELARRGNDVEVLTLDAPSPAVAATIGVPVHALGPSTGAYSWNRRLVPWLQARADQYDVVVVNGLWQYAGFGTWQALRGTTTPYAVFPHGMLDPWFKQAHPLKHAKKSLYWPWAEYRVLRDAAAVLFTCEEERRLASESFRLYRARERIVTLGTERPPGDAERFREAFLTSRPELRGRRLVTFLGRLHPKKACDQLIEAFARVAAQHTGVDLVFAGPDDVGWRAALERRAAELGVDRRIAWTGMLSGDQKWGALYACEVLALPSHQENFGFAVAEALACGVPALLSTKVNIWREVIDDGAGFAEADTIDGTERLLRRWLDLTADERTRMSAAARGCFERRFTVGAMGERLLEVLGASRPTGTSGSVR